MSAITATATNYMLKLSDDDYYELVTKFGFVDLGPNDDDEYDDPPAYDEPITNFELVDLGPDDE